MDTVEFYTIGQHVEKEALRLKQLYENVGIDEYILEEFGTTVEAYRTLPLPEISARLQARYTGEAPTTHGVIARVINFDYGMAIWGLKAYSSVTPTGEVQQKEGINVSAWVLRQNRGFGFGKLLIAHATMQAAHQAQNPQRSDLLGKPIWTSIHRDNTASIRACQEAGFRLVSVQPEKPERDIYEHTSL